MNSTINTTSNNSNQYTNSNEPKKIWYEKTVEYAFVRTVPKIGCAPLDGNSEKAGDGIFQNNGKYFLVEFKKECNNESIKQERDKYTNWDSVKLKLDKCSGNKAHFFIYGESNNRQFKLKHINYINTFKKEELKKLFKIKKETNNQKILEQLETEKKLIKTSINIIDKLLKIYNNTKDNNNLENDVDTCIKSLKSNKEYTEHQEFIIEIEKTSNDKNIIEGKKQYLQRFVLDLSEIITSKEDIKMALTDYLSKFEANDVDENFIDNIKDKMITLEELKSYIQILFDEKKGSSGGFSLENIGDILIVDADGNSISILEANEIYLSLTPNLNTNSTYQTSPPAKIVEPPKKN